MSRLAVRYWLYRSRWGRRYRRGSSAPFEGTKVSGDELTDNTVSSFT